MSNTPLAALIIRSVWPVPEDAIGDALTGIDRIVVPELNLGLYAREIERLAGDREVVGVNRIDGDLISPQQILEVAT
jgi:2-oxoglutarate ferredoxin oxidoreductase subunit alpha